MKALRRGIYATALSSRLSKEASSRKATCWVITVPSSTVTEMLWGVDGLGNRTTSGYRTLLGKDRWI